MDRPSCTAPLRCVCLPTDPPSPTASPPAADEMPPKERRRFRALGGLRSKPPPTLLKAGSRDDTGAPPSEGGAAPPAAFCTLRRPRGAPAVAEPGRGCRRSGGASPAAISAARAEDDAVPPLTLLYPRAASPGSTREARRPRMLPVPFGPPPAALPASAMLMEGLVEGPSREEEERLRVYPARLPDALAGLSRDSVWPAAGWAAAGARDACAAAMAGALAAKREAVAKCCFMSVPSTMSITCERSTSLTWRVGRH